MMRHGRWYDAFPRLAFALQLLRLTPPPVREQALEDLSDLLDDMVGPLIDEAMMAACMGSGQRWYDLPEEADAALHRLKSAPTRVKNAAADHLLGSIARCA